ncbi:uncharacterized protein LOC122450930 [Cervus canadensis]|uniref:uncharacterized protein LOC122450930 n=1 Tax=Cervus canadensis TaxID=1574408 RepID=UPI001C9E4F7A|nr:uncharacterized protein LOC122450930 [Cervus canadensis]
MRSSAAPKANAEIPKAPLSCQRPEGAGPGLERRSANPGNSAFFSAWPRAEEELSGSVGRTGVAATPAGTSPSSSRGEGPAELGHFLISPRNPTPCPGLQVGLRPLRLVRPAPGIPIPVASVPCRAQSSGRRGRGLRVIPGGHLPLPNPVDAASSSPPCLLLNRILCSRAYELKMKIIVINVFQKPVKEDGCENTRRTAVHVTR